MSNDKAKEKLGFEVITDMYSGIDKYIDYYLMTSIDFRFL